MQRRDKKTSQRPAHSEEKLNQQNLNEKNPDQSEEILSLQGLTSKTLNKDAAEAAGKLIALMQQDLQLTRAAPVTLASNYKSACESQGSLLQLILELNNTIAEFQKTYQDGKNMNGVDKEVLYADIDAIDDAFKKLIAARATYERHYDTYLRNSNINQLPEYSRLQNEAERCLVLINAIKTKKLIGHDKEALAIKERLIAAHTIEVAFISSHTAEYKQWLKGNENDDVSKHDTEVKRFYTLAKNNHENNFSNSDFVKCTKRQMEHDRAETKRQAISPAVTSNASNPHRLQATSKPSLTQTITTSTTVARPGAPSFIRS